MITGINSRVYRAYCSVPRLRRKVDIMSKNKSSQPDFDNKSNHNGCSNNSSQPDFGDKPQTSTSSKSKTSKNYTD